MKSPAPKPIGLCSSSDDIPVPLSRLPRIRRRVARILSQPRRLRVRLEKPDRAIGIVAAKLLILGRTQVASPDDPGAVDVRSIVDPFLEPVLRPVTEEHQLLPWNL